MSVVERTLADIQARTIERTGLVSALLEERFRCKVEITTEEACWIWTASVDGSGYGKYLRDGRLVGAHRVAYEVVVGPIPDGLEIDHLCKVRNCVNPAHMEAVTHRENTLRSDSPVVALYSETHCSKGHEWTEENTYIKKGGRECRICRRDRNREYMREYRARKRG